ncbi:MAG TPA: hypothetical protein VJ938_11575 [Acidimicrobiia bacterium]|jgi:hypothetical protein|nr:hypothetical protein [Acidimicrobiia bacterium]
MLLRRLVAICLLVIASLASSLAASATEETTDTTTATETTVAEGQGSGVAPAVTVPVEEEDTGPDDWTYRYLIPTLIALAVIVVIATTIQYFLQVVRKRYKVVE